MNAYRCWHVALRDTALTVVATSAREARAIVADAFDADPHDILVQWYAPPVRKRHGIAEGVRH